MTEWQNRVKDTLQYCVTARWTHRGLKGAKSKKRKEKQGKESNRSNICVFLFSMASITWSVMGEEAVTNMDVEKVRDTNSLKFRYSQLLLQPSKRSLSFPFVCEFLLTLPPSVSRYSCLPHVFSLCASISTGSLVQDPRIC
ncbi:hypothetical protein JOB18_030880 [Solea senegalensis]|uniref:Uncharacterized protein n=1 Tax=Solea senegalensis TaxID=28829 RepID=A0AAV6QDH4_SOLSE|nr:hypothetical protein JOB18_030880 [Solea senegalensis]